MIRLTSIEKEKISELVKQGRSIREIAVILGRNKTTIYYHFRKNKGATLKPIKKNFEDHYMWGEFLGLVAGDGCLTITKEYHYRIRLFFNKTEKEYVKELKNLLQDMFGKPPQVFRKLNVITLYYCSKQLY